VANTFLSGIAGDVLVAGVSVAGIKLWRLDQTTAEIGIPHFQSFVDASGRMWPDYLPGLSGATGTLEGYFDVNAGNPTDSIITTGIYVTMKLRFSKTTLWGFAVYALITAFGASSNVENQPNSFTASFRVSNAVPLSAVV